MVDLIPPLDTSNTSTAPGDEPAIAAVGTATYAVMLSGAVAMLLVAPGRLIDPAEASLALLITAILFSALLKTRVFVLSGVMAISPGLEIVPLKPTTAGTRRSVVAFTMFRTGALPVPLGNRGFDTKTRNATPPVLLPVPPPLEPPE